MRKLVIKIFDIIFLNFLKNKKLKTFLMRRIEKDHISRSIDLLKSLNLSDFIIVDVGACKGEENDTTRRFSRAFPKAEILAFEPFPESYKKLAENAKNIGNIKTFNIALSDYTGDNKLFVTNTVSSSSLLEINRAELDKLSPDFSNSLKTAGNFEIVKVDRLDNIISDKNIGILKIDTQGSELNVLKGSENNLKNAVIILLECSNHKTYKNSSKYYEIDAFLRDKGYELYDLIPSMYSEGRLYEWDSIYINSLIKKK